MHVLREVTPQRIYIQYPMAQVAGNKRFAAYEPGGAPPPVHQLMPAPLRKKLLERLGQSDNPLDVLCARYGALCDKFAAGQANARMLAQAEELVTKYSRSLAQRHRFPHDNMAQNLGELCEQIKQRLASSATATQPAAGSPASQPATDRLAIAPLEVRVQSLSGRVRPLPNPEAVDSSVKGPYLLV
jgi:hypothetical protein